MTSNEVDYKHMIHEFHRQFQESVSQQPEKAKQILHNMRALHGKMIHDNIKIALQYAKKSPSTQEYLYLSGIGTSTLLLGNCILECESHLQNTQASAYHIEHPPGQMTRGQADVYLNVILAGGHDDLSGTTLIMFTSKACGVCQAFQSDWQQFRKLMAAKHPHVRVESLDIHTSEQAREIAQEANVRATPTFIIYHKGKQTRLAGRMPVQTLMAAVEDTIKR